MEPYKATDDTYVLPHYEKVPRFGLLPVNAFLVRAREPVLIDTGGSPSRDEFLSALWSLVEPQDLKWLFLTHENQDHVGCVREVLDAAPNARLVTNFAGLGKLVAEWPVPMNRVLLLNPGQSFSAGDREYVTFLPPLFDSGATLGLFDKTNRVLFPVDSFGAFIPTPVHDVADLRESDFAEGFSIWNRANHPWVTLVDQEKFGVTLERIQRLQPKVVMSSHSPPSRYTAALLEAMAELPSLEPLVLPDQTGLQAILAAMRTGRQTEAVS